MHIILGILGGLVGLGGRGGLRFLLGAVVGILIAEVLAQRRRIAALEKASHGPRLRHQSLRLFLPLSDEDEAAGA